MNNEAVVIYGAGGHARELKFQLQLQGVEVLAFVDDFNSSRVVDDVSVLSPKEALSRFSTAKWHVAIGNISARKGIAENLLAHNVHLGSFISERALIAPTAIVEAPAQIFANCVVSAGAFVRKFSVLNFGSIISHDVEVGSFSYVSPGVRVAGHVIIGSSVWLGVGCSIRNGNSDVPLRIGDHVTIGAGACVVNDIDDNQTVVGIPAKELRTHRE